MRRRVLRSHRRRSGFGWRKVSAELINFWINIYIASDFTDEHSKRLAVLEERVKVIDKLAQETAHTTLRMDAMEGSVNRFAGALETFLGRIQIDDRLRLVPDRLRISPAPFPTTPSASPTTPLDLPVAMDEDDDLGVESSSAQETQTTPSDLQGDMRMEEVGPIASGSGSVPSPDSSPLPSIATEAPLPASQGPPPPPSSLPTIAVIPAIPSSPLAAGNDAPPPPPPPLVVRSRSRTPATKFLDVGERTTRSRSRSKTPI
jgi:hypothetical protein